MGLFRIGNKAPDTEHHRVLCDSITALSYLHLMSSPVLLLGCLKYHECTLEGYALSRSLGHYRSPSAKRQEVRCLRHGDIGGQ